MKHVGLGEQVLNGMRTTFVDNSVTPEHSILRAGEMGAWTDKGELRGPLSNPQIARAYGLRWFGRPWRAGMGSPDHSEGRPVPGSALREALTRLARHDDNPLHLDERRFGEFSLVDELDMEMTDWANTQPAPGIGTLAQVWERTYGETAPWLSDNGTISNPQPVTATWQLEGSEPVPSHRLVLVGPSLRGPWYIIWDADEETLRRYLGSRWPRAWDGEPDPDPDPDPDPKPDPPPSDVDRRVLELEAMIGQVLSRLGAFWGPMRTFWAVTGKPVKGGEIPRRTALRALVRLSRRG